MTRSKTTETPRRRSRKPRINLRKIRNLIITNPLEAFMVLLLVLAVILFINPFPSIDLALDTLPFGLGGFALNVGRWVAYEGGAQFSGGIFVAVAVGIVLVRVRQRALHNPAHWSNRCPNCEQDALHRIHRTTGEHILNRLSIPVRRYKCKECKWEGRRIDEHWV